ncbi:thioredoxin domain-containing protein [Rhodobacteraceae bacterium NNCM2]|nr:thioredoxin domain-containing protein [Coraliihabitans acroporae]
MNRFSAVAAALCMSLVYTAPAMAQQSTALSSMSPAERAEFQSEVRAYLLENPEVILEALEILEERREQQAQAADLNIIRSNSEAIFEDGYSFVAGNPDGDITIVEFTDYRCGYCKQAHPEVASLIASDPNIRLIVKEFPILGPESVAAGRMALAAVEVDASLFGELNERLMSFPGNLTEDMAYRIAGNVGYDVDALKAEAESDATTAKLEENYRLAQELGLRGTPSFILSDEVIRGYVPAADMKKMIAEKRHAALSD